MTLSTRWHMMWWRTLLFGLVAAMAAQFGGLATAGTVDVFSSAGTGTNNMGGTNFAINPVPAWATPPAGSAWISYNPNTGCVTPPSGPCGSGIDQPPAWTSGPATATFYQTFTISDSLDSGFITIWADDTAAAYIDTGTVTSGDGSTSVYGGYAWPANFILGTNCANGPIGCLQNNGYAFDVSIPTGTYTLVMDGYQLLSSTPFGVMYNGVLTDTPEPASYILLGLGLAGLGILAKRRDAHKTRPTA